MVCQCPHCGTSLKFPILHGIASCNNCRRVFDSSPFNCVLSAAWFIRRHHIETRELLQMQGFEPWVVEVVLDLVVEKLYTHEELIRALKESKVCNRFPCESQRCEMCEHYKTSLDLAS